jgi:formylmethanofuran--tetrahydromethanopterin N-formyltransferase
MILGRTEIEDTFAEAFGMRATRIVVTADTAHWARIAGETATGFATSVIACGAEAGIERELAPEETPDGRPGIALLFFAISRDALAKALRDRVGQCVLTCPGTACYAGIEEGEKLPLGRALRYFGDGYEFAKRLDGRRFWRIPVMDGEFLCEDTIGQKKAVGGGNFLMLGVERRSVLAAAERAIAAMRALPGVIMPFPGGIAGSGSKAGSKYKFSFASTYEKYCPLLRDDPAANSALPPGVNSVMEIIINGRDLDSIIRATQAAIAASVNTPGLLRISAGNYGGRLGKSFIYLHQGKQPAVTPGG